MEPRERTKKLLVAHYRAYPKLQIQDIFKFLYQSTFGCEHLVSSVQAATDSISEEYDKIQNTGIPVIEPLDGSYSRVPFLYLGQGLGANTLAKLFVFSSKQEEHALQDLLQKLPIVRELICEGGLPFSEKDFEEALSAWESQNYSAVHHSAVFRERYHPSYRVIANQYIPFLPLFARLDGHLAKGRVTVAIEGGSASGKTTLGQMLSQVYDCTLFHMDDFFLQPYQRTPKRYTEIGGNVDRERFLEEVLQPLSRGETVYYRAFDCSTMGMGEETQVLPQPLTVIEGVYSMHPDLEPYYDFSVFLDVSPQIQEQRIRRRNSAQTAQLFFEKWIPLEQTYFSQTKAKERCNMVISVSE